MQKTYSPAEQEHIIARINGTMALEGMPLTEENKVMLRDMLSGRKTEAQCIEDLQRKWREISREMGGNSE